MWQLWLTSLPGGRGVAPLSRLPRSQAMVIGVCLGLFFAVLMGFRHVAGGDWFIYPPAFQDVGLADFGQVISKPDPSYYGLNWLVGRLDGNIYWVNFVCAAVLMWGMVDFCPFDERLRGPLRDWCEALLSETRLRRVGLLDLPLVRDACQAHLAGASNGYRLWSLLIFQAWLGRNSAPVRATPSGIAA